MLKRLLLVLLGTVLALPLFITAQDTPEPPDIMPIIEPPPGGVFTNPEWMSIDHHRVNIEVENQIAATTVDMQFTNNGEGFVEGTFLFPLPAEAAVDNLVMFVNGQAIEAKILRAEEARAIYDEIVRQYRDPALLEYVGTNAIQANVFPIPPGESRRIELGYTQILEVDNGLIKVSYPMETPATNNRMVDEMSLSVRVTSNDPIANIYSPSHNIATNREDDRAFRVGFERNNYTPDGDFVLYYGLENDSITVNLLTYRESADGDGFFMLLVQPPVEVDTDQVVAKDVIVVLDQSGSMDGEKWRQAQSATEYVLDNLNPDDRFNVVAFSTGWRVFSDQLENATVAPEAIDWVNGMWAEGGTDINGALLTALDFADGERPTTILFLTDGLATEGVIETDAILENVDVSAGNNVRVFTFGVGDDVDTQLLDSISRDFRGASSYVRPFESIEEEVSSLYNKIAAPVLTDIELNFGDVRTDLIYPAGQLPDLFAGEQLTIVGRYRNGAEGVTVTVNGEVRGEAQAFTYENFDFRERAGGEAFIARLWATRRIGDLLNTIRLNGESEELVDSVVNLSLRYGIITPYTSFLIEEDDILSQQGRDRATNAFREEAEALADDFTGAGAVDAAEGLSDLSSANAPVPSAPIATQGAAAPRSVQPSVGAAAPQEDMDADAEIMFEAEEDAFAGEPAGREALPPIKSVGDKTFILQSGVYTDTTFDPDTMQTQPIVFLSDAYFDLILEFPELADYFAVGEAVIVVYEGVAYEIVPE